MRKPFQFASSLASSTVSHGIGYPDIAVKSIIGGGGGGLKEMAYFKL
jgi:acetyl/propionyl-CoA carboxylase alpha subunit